jgi:preprotein translocase subunit YajC
MPIIPIFAQAGQGGGAMGILGSPLILIGVMFLIMYFMIIRPQQKKMKEHQALVSALKRGDSVVMNGGMHGTVYEVNEKTVLVEVSKNNVITFDKGSVQSVVRE